MNIPSFSYCNFCGTHQKISDVCLCSACGAPFKPDEPLSPIKAILSNNIRLFTADEWCTHIIDISHWQGNINPSVYNASDSKYLNIKAGQGDWQDTKYQQNVQMCLDNEFPFGIYHFMDVRYSADEAAKKFADQFNALQGTQVNEFSKSNGFCFVRAWLDVEANYGKSPEYLREYIRDFIRIFEMRTGYKLGIYTRASFWNDFVALMDDVHELPLWVAHYNTWISDPDIPNDWERFGKTWELWQYSADGNGEGYVYGAESSSIDKNRFNGDCIALHNNFIGDEEIEPPPPPLPPDDCLTLKVINTNALRVRDEPSTIDGTILYILERDHVVDIQDIIVRNNETWIQIAEGEYSAMWYHGSQYLKKYNGE